MNDNTTKRKEVIIKAANIFGRNSQLDMLVEECSELIQAIQKLKRTNFTGQDQFMNMCEEIADVKIVIEQIEYLIGTNQIESFDYMKIKRLSEIIENK